MLSLRQMRRNASGVAILLAVVVGTCAWVWSDPGAEILRTIPTGASFNLAVTRSRDGADALRLASSIEDAGLPAFTRAVNKGASREVVVGPFISIDEAETARRRLVARGFGAQLLVDESVRRRPGHDGVPQLSTTANLVLIAGAGRLSLVIEMPEEPQHLETRRVTPTMMEVDIGPVASPVHAQRWRAPEGVTLLERIEFEEAAESSGLLRARVSLSDETLSHVRMLGSRLYIDLWRADSMKIDREVVVARRNPPPAPMEPVDENMSAPEPLAQPPAKLPAKPEFDYRQIVAPTVARLESMAPFVHAAVAAPNPEVLTALRGTLKGLKRWLEAVEPPTEWLDTHQSLIAVASFALTSVEPGFMGDRTVLAGEAFSLLARTKPSLSDQTIQNPPTTIAKAAPATIAAR